MAYDAQLAQRVRTLLENKSGFAEKKMFGGICFLLHGNMACGIIDSDLIVRVGVDHYHEALAQPATREFDVTGRPMKGWVMVSVTGHGTAEALAAWVAKGVNFALTLPAK